MGGVPEERLCDLLPRSEGADSNSDIITSLGMERWDNMESCDIFMPEDVVTEILSRLPVKPVLRFKSVCKGWYSLIKTSCFHTKHLLNYHNNQKPQVYVYNYSHQYYTQVFNLIPEDTRTVNHDLDNIDLYQYLTIAIGPVNGLFFLLCDDVATLWNPATREFRSVPLPLPSASSFYGHSFGFGFDPLTNEYKIVWIWSIWDEDDHPVDSGCELYTLSDDSWASLKIEDSVLDSIRLLTWKSCFNWDEDYKPSTGAYLNGGYYWLAGTENDPYHQTIVMLDLSTHVFKEIEVPGDTEFETQWSSLVLHDDSIALIGYGCAFGEVYYLSMWARKEEGWWTLIFRVSSCVPVIQPLDTWNESEIFGLDARHKLVLYDHKTDETRDVVEVDRWSAWWSIYKYKDSLVSLNGGDNSSNLVCYRRKGDELWEPYD